jgi:1-acyl-sn-glycerol-3-phosphate acyltransferase
VLPYVRRLHGFREVPRGRRIFVSNHVSLLDTILLGGVFWSRRRTPILVLGDQAVWSRSAVRRLLSAEVGFLIDRTRPTKERIAELRDFGASLGDFNLIVFPEGTRGDGLHVAECQPGLYYLAREARAPIVPLFIENMQRVSSKSGPLRPLRGLQRIRVRFGPEIPPAVHLAMRREEFLRHVRERIQALGPRT